MLQFYLINLWPAYARNATCLFQTSENMQHFGFISKRKRRTWRIEVEFLTSTCRDKNINNSWAEIFYFFPILVGHSMVCSTSFQIDK